MRKKKPKFKGLLEQYKGLSFAEAAEQISKKYANREIDRAQRSAYNLAMKMLARRQEIERQKLLAEQAVKSQQQAMQQQMAMNNTGVAQQQAEAQGASAPQEMQFAFGGFTDPEDQITNRYSTPVSKPLDPLPGIPQSTTATRIADLAKNTIQGFKPPKKRNYGQSSFSAKLEDLSKNAYTPAILGTAINFGANAALMAGGYDKFDPMYNPNENESLRMLERTRLNDASLRERVLSSFNKARMNTDSVRSSSVQNALSADIAQREAAALADTKLNIDKVNMQADASLANALATFGGQKMQAMERARTLTTTSKSNYQSNLSTASGAIADSLKFFTENKLNTIQQKMLARTLALKYKDFGISQEVVDKYQRGELPEEEFLTIAANAFGLSNLPAWDDYMEYRKKNKNKDKNKTE